MRQIVMRFSVTGAGMAGGHGMLEVSVLPDEESGRRFFNVQRREMDECYGTEGELKFADDNTYVAYDDGEQGLWFFACPNCVVPGERVCVVMSYGRPDDTGVGIPIFDPALEHAVIYFGDLTDEGRDENTIHYEDDLVTALASGETDIRIDDPEKGGFCWVVTPVEGKLPEDVQKFADGSRVLLRGDLKEGWVEERATVDGYEGDGMYVVTVDKPWDPDDVDGLREVNEEHMEELKEVVDPTHDLSGPCFPRD